MLSVNNINVFYRKIQALWAVSFDVMQREIVVMLGSNGAGKSTTLNTLAGLLHPSSGSIRFLCQEIQEMPSFKIVSLSISLVPEGGAFFSKMTVNENLELGAYGRKDRGKNIESLKWIYEIFPVLKLKGKKLASTLSGGERQMLAIARGLMRRPKLLMLDEPSYGLAPLMVSQTFKTVKQLRDLGTTILVVEQNSKHALAVGDRGYLLENGKIVLGDTCENLRQNEYVRKCYLGL
ncbi:MAG: ABC transporter ATP-binding protein [Deltaproteobacteria bacterium]|nr:ABC transporter ATP-binding protein [Deltaproteobacteria bacterium]MBW2044164.1 ABC transporter ATP-binding protein [Deltaproteobacteria bacterium]MBW2300549.1 ABC transporter ATP-binding protein [Deltaproteobacteria bacterium]